MKKIITTILASIFLMNSCYDLDRSSYREIDEETFWKTENQLKQGMMGVYSTMRISGAFGWSYANDCMSDIAVGTNHYGLETAIKGTGTSDSWYVFDNKWKQTFDGVHKANMVIRNVEKVEGLKDGVKEQYIGEAKFMRALYYLELCNFYGKVPIYDESIDLNINPEDLNKVRSSAEDVLKFIIDDLTATVNSPLPDKWDNANQGRATKGAAYALRGKVYLYAKEYQLAKNDFLEAMKPVYGYNLHPNYAELFKPGADASSEMIFSIQNYTAAGQQYGMPLAFYIGNRSTFKGSCWNNVVPSTSFVESYERKDGKPFDWEDYFPGYTTSETVKGQVFKSKLNEKLTAVVSYPEKVDELKAMYADRDPRMQQTIILPYTEYLGYIARGGVDQDNLCEYVYEQNGKALQATNHFVEIQGNDEVYLYRKFVPESNLNGAWLTWGDREHTPIKFPLIRLADVYLMHAECLNELGDQAGAVEYINKVRQRSSTGMPAINSGPAWLAASGTAEVHKRIMHERAVELALEGHRWNDIRRWGVALDIIPTEEKGFLGGKIGGKNGYIRNKTEKALLWPVPGSDIEKLPLLAPNNPGF